jgi:CheY-like chemotaxis protein
MLARRILFGTVFLACVVLAAPAQQPPGKGKGPMPPAGPAPVQRGDDYRQFFKKPETTQEYWNAMKFEMEVGRFDLAAAHLRGLMQKKPTEQELVDLEKADGTAAFLRLRLVPRWVEVPPTADEKTRAALDAKDAQAKKDANDLIDQVTAAVRKHYSDPDRIKKYVARLLNSPEEAEYALKQLYRSGALVVPYMIEQMRRAEPKDRVPLLWALEKLGPEVVPPLIAALDSNDPVMQLDILDVLRRKRAAQAVPYLWYLMGSSNNQEMVRHKAAELLGYLLGTPVSKLPPAKIALTREAERYYNHQVQFADPKAVTVWRWDGGVVAGWPNVPTIPATQAELYYATRFATQALSIDPTYDPAQQLLASLILDKNYEQAGLAQPLARTRPDIHQLLATLSPDLLTRVLERALTEDRLPVILGTVRILGDLAEVKAGHPRARSEPALLRAINYADRRVQMAAAEALIRVPGLPSPQAAARVVEVLRRALAAEPAGRTVPRVLVGQFDEEQLNRLAGAVKTAGYDVVKATTGRAVMARLREAADIDLLILDANLPDPGLPHLLGQLKADQHANQLPLILFTSAPREDQLRRFVQRRNVVVTTEDALLDPNGLRTLLKTALGDVTRAPLTEPELREQAEKAMYYLGVLARRDVPGYDVRPAADAVTRALQSGRLSPQGQVAAISFLGTLSGGQPETELLNIVASNRPNEIRTVAASELVRYIQQHGLALNREQVGRLEQLYAQKDLDPNLRSGIAGILGSLRPDARMTGERLLQYRPPTPRPPMPPPMPPPGGME